MSRLYSRVADRKISNQINGSEIDVSLTTQQYMVVSYY
jgi:hypothetical protein